MTMKSLNGRGHLATHRPGGRGRKARPPRRATTSSRSRPGGQAILEEKLAATEARLRDEISGRKRVERRQLEAEQGLCEVRERFESAFGNAPIGMALIDMDGHWLQVNHALCRITGLTAGELKATTLRAITHPDDLDIDAEDRQALLAGRIPSYQVEKRYRHAWGHDVWVLLTVSLVRDQAGGALYAITQAQDISERKHLAGRLEYLVDHDFLTGLFNRRHFERALARESERIARYGGPAAVLLMDLDNFKDVNDSFGHKAGDDLLRGVAALLRQRTRETDLLARIGGDEFAVLLPETDADRAEAVADDVVKALGRQTAVLANQSVRVTASIGVAMFDNLTDTEVLAYADLAMYEAKDAGRNRLSMYRPYEGRREKVSARFAEVERIRRALEENRLLVYGQPILDLATSEVSSYEILLRLPDERGGEPLPPSAFLYAAERSGLIQAIDAWVLRRAIELIVQHGRAGRRLVLNVNLSANSIGDPKMAALAEQAIADAGIDPALLVFEITETTAIANVERAKVFADRLCALGCQFALDDFGAGFGSFYYIKSLPFDYLKIDGAFIRGFATSPMDQLIVKAIVSIAKGLGKKTVAEFAGDAETVRLLREIGVDSAQGHQIGRARPIAELLGPMPS